MEAQNHWQPVTDVYQQIIDPVAIAQLDGDPTRLIQAARRAQRSTEARAPFGITAVTTVFLLRAAIYALFAAKLATSADSQLTYWISSHCPALVPIAFGTMSSKTMTHVMAEALGVMAVLSLGIGVLWTLRWKPVLIVTLAISAYTIIHIVLSYLGVAGLGDPNLFAPEQLDLLVAEGALSLLTFLYIALYPGLKNQFHSHL